MGNRRVLVFALAGFSTLVRARAASGQTLGPSLPPHMVLHTSDGGEQRAALGTYCWGGKCVDKASPVYYPACSLPIAAGETLTLDFAALGPLRRLSYSFWPYAENIQSGPRIWSAKTSSSPVHHGILILPVSLASLPVHLRPGLFVIDVFARARRGGSTYQGFKLLVEPDSAPATPEAMPAATPLAGTVCEDAGE